LSSSENLYLDLDLLKYILPQGIPRNSFIVLAGDAGSGKSVLATLIAKNVMEHGEPAVFVALDDDPLTVAQQFRSYAVDVEELQSKGLFYIVDGYSYLLAKESTKFSKYAVATVNPTSDLSQLLYTIYKVLDDRNISGRGVLVLDSLNILLNYHEPSRVLEAVKALRANVSKLRSVVVLALLHTGTQYYNEFLNSIVHIVDGIWVTEVVVQHPLSGEIPLPLRQILVKRMKGVQHRVSWTLFLIDREGVKPVKVRIESSESGAQR